MNNSQLHPEHKPPHYTFPPSNTQQTKRREINERKKTWEKKRRRRKVKTRNREIKNEKKRKKKKKNNNDSAGRRNRPDWSCKLNAVVGFLFSTFNETASSVFCQQIFFQKLIGTLSFQSQFNPETNRILWNR